MTPLFSLSRYFIHFKYMIVFQMYYPYIDTYEFYENLPIYILFTIIIFFLTIFVTIKLAFPFWNLQPVYHTYDFWRILYREPFHIHKRFVIQNITKFSNFQQIQTYDYNDVSQSLKETFTDILQCFYLPQEQSIFVLNVEKMFPLLASNKPVWKRNEGM